MLAALAAVAALVVAGPAAAQQRTPEQPVDVYIEVNPSTIQAGFQVQIRASCGDDVNPARAKSDAFGEITLTPQGGSQWLTGTATVPASTKPGNYKVNLTCANGATAATVLDVLDMARPTRGPATGGGGIAVGADRSGGSWTLWLVAAGGTAFLIGAGLLLLRPGSR